MQSILEGHLNATNAISPAHTGIQQNSWGVPGHHRKVDVRLPGKGKSRSHVGPPHHYNALDSDQQLVNKELSLPDTTSLELFENETGDSRNIGSRLSTKRACRNNNNRRGTSLIRKRPPPRTIIGPQAWAYCRVLGKGIFSSARYPCTTIESYWWQQSIRLVNFVRIQRHKFMHPLR